MVICSKLDHFTFSELAQKRGSKIFFGWGSQNVVFDGINSLFFGPNIFLRGSKKYVFFGGGGGREGGMTNERPETDHLCRFSEKFGPPRNISDLSGHLVPHNS